MTELHCNVHGLTKHTANAERPRCLKCNYESIKKRRKRIKEKAVAYKGGCCQECGYDRELAALEFHHLDPSEKDIQIGRRANSSWDRIQRELDKCVLLCANCHREVHAGSRVLMPSVAQTVRALD